MLGCSVSVTVLLMRRVLGGAARSLTTESHRVVESARCRRHPGNEGLGFGNCLGNGLSRACLDEAVVFLNVAPPYHRNEDDDVKVTCLLYCYTIFTLTAGSKIQMPRLAKNKSLYEMDAKSVQRVFPAVNTMDLQKEKKITHNPRTSLSSLPNRRHK